MYLVFDIETVVDPDLPLAEGQDATKVPPAPHHRVVVLGALLLSGSVPLPKRLGIVGKESTDEATILREFAELVEKHRPTLVSYNGRGFDLPVIAARCLHHGIPFSAYYQVRDMRYRFTEAGHFDLMDYMTDFGATKAVRLDVMAKLVGMPGKVGVDGKDVGPLVHRGRIDEVRNYCLCDVVQTAAVLLRVQLLRGALSRADYLTAMRALLAQIETDERVVLLSPLLDLNRLLLGEPLAAPLVDETNAASGEGDAAQGASTDDDAESDDASAMDDREADDAMRP